MKKGIDYFPLDVDFFEDEKIQFVSARFGIKGEVCAIRLLTRIYRNGYFVKWDEDSSYLFAKVAGKEFTPGLVNEVVNELIKRGFFDETLFDSLGILTSHGIQERFFKACERRKSVEVDQQLLLVDPTDFKNLKISMSSLSMHSNGKCKHDVNILDKNVDISIKNDNISSQSRVEKSKEEYLNTLSCNHDGTVKKAPKCMAEIKQIVTYLNQVTGQHYKPTTKKTQSLIHARLKEGFSLHDFKTVINKKSYDWLNNPEMCAYLRPETLFGTKFEGYLNQKATTRTMTLGDQIKADRLRREQRDNDRRRSAGCDRMAGKCLPE